MTIRSVGIACRSAHHETRLLGAGAQSSHCSHRTKTVQLVDSHQMSRIGSINMSKRLKVLFEDAEYLESQASARRCRMTVAEWVRQALRRARHGHPATVEARRRPLRRPRVTSSQRPTSTSCFACSTPLAVSRGLRRLERVVSFDRRFQRRSGDRTRKLICTPVSPLHRARMA